MDKPADADYNTLLRKAGNGKRESPVEVRG
jgi:hypothetical protein